MTDDTGEPRRIEPGCEPLVNEKWEKFCLLVATKGQPVAEAYEMAGFKPDADNARRFSKRTEIATRIRYLKVQRADTAVQTPLIPQEKIDATSIYVIDGLIENAEIALGRKTVVVKFVKKGRKKGEEPTVIQCEITDRNGSVANAALIALGKNIGMFQEKTLATADDPARQAPIKTVSDERAVELLAGCMTPELREKLLKTYAPKPN